MHSTKRQNEKEHSTHSQCVNTGQCGESSETKEIYISEDGPIRPKHVVGKTCDIFI
jgi:hypothetical protein